MYFFFQFSLLSIFLMCSVLLLNLLLCGFFPSELFFIHICIKPNDMSVTAAPLGAVVYLGSF